LAGSATLRLNNVNLNEAGNYTVIVSSPWGSVTSSVASLVVVTPPVIASQPQSLTVTNGSPASFSVSVSGTGPLVYQWQKDQTNLADGGNLSGSGTATLVLNQTTTNDAGGYMVIISSAWGSVTSSVAVLTIVIPPPVITQQPASQTVALGGTASFSVAVFSLEPCTFQWYFNGIYISGATNSALTLNEVQPSQAGIYAVLVTNAFGSILSSNASLTVLTPPVILVQPTNQIVVAGGTAVFSIEAGGTAPLSYQWSFNGANIGGATNTSLTLSSVQLIQAGTYAVLVTNLFGSILSSNAALTVTPDHFTWGQIPSLRFVNTPFSVTVQARDLANGILTNFAGSVFLDSTNAVAVSPALSGNFVAGSWTGAVVISQTVTNLVLRASDGAGHFGFANPINVLPLPPLSLRIYGDTVLVLWPVGYSGFMLQTSGDLSETAWTTVSVSPLQIGSQFLVPLPLSRTNCFYRLRFAGP